MKHAVRTGGLVIAVVSAAATVTACGSDDASTGGSGGAGAAAGAAGHGGMAGQGAQGGSAGVGNTAGVGATGGVGGGQGGSAGSGVALAPTSDVSFTEQAGFIANPERGFYRAVNVTSETDLSWAAADGVTLVYSYVRLDDYRDSAIPASVFSAVNAGLDAARAAGLKVILRFAYNFGPYPNSEPDASKAQILAHIAQAQPELAANEDVIALVQAGFIGAWGEWHTSTNDLLADPADRKQIIEALLDATPVGRTTAIRYPLYKQEMYPTLTDVSAYQGDYASRTGHHNDCFLSSDTDVGTYPDGQVESLKDYLAQDTAYVPMGGETCATDPRNACSVATAEMQRLHYTYLNLDYHTDVLDRFRSEGCFETMREKMGYRIVLRAAKLPTDVRPGGRFRMELRLDNVGWAAPINQRAVEVRLRSAGETISARAATVDVRRWAPGVVTLSLAVQLPSGLAPGSYDLALALPDESATLGGRAEYAMRLATENVWKSASADHVLGQVAVADSAPGGAATGVVQMSVTTY